MQFPEKIKTYQTTEELENAEKEKNTEELIERVRQKILGSLRLYPGISLSMLHYAMATPAVLWRAQLEQMIHEGLVTRIMVYDESIARLREKYFAAADSSKYIELIEQTMRISVIY